MRLRLLPLTVALAAAPPPAPAHSPFGSLIASADAYLRAEMQARGIPGLAAAVVREGRIVAAQAYGIANLELGVPVSLQTVFPIASLDKQLTASGIMLLVGDGKLRLDDEVGSHLADAPPSWKGIQVRHLLSHTSGLPDVVAEEVDGREFTSYSTEQLLATVKRQVLLSKPGAAYAYSDAGLFLAQLLTERVSGVSWRRFMADRVFAPAGMASMAFMDAEPIVKNRVAGYRTEGGELVSNRRTAVDYGPLYNDVGATVVDFARWTAALDTDRVLPRSLRDQMWTPAVRADDTWSWRDYGLGFGLDRYRGTRVVLHSGFTGVGVVLLPEQRIAVVVFTNLDNRWGADAHGLALGVAGIYAPEVSLLEMAPGPDPDPRRTERLRAELARLTNGTPDLGQYAAPLSSGIAASASAFETRRLQAGPLQSLTFLGAVQEAGETLLYYRAAFAKARYVLRVGFDEGGRIACLQGIHV